MLSAIACNLNLFCGVNFDQLFLFLVPFGLILVANELLDKKTDLPREVHRKFGHVFSGLLIIVASYYLGYVEMIFFSIALIFGALGTKVLKSKFKTIYEVKRQTFGTPLFALVTLILTLLWFQDAPELLRYGIWILTVPDAAAALIGSRWGRQLPKWHKSKLGSLVFFLLTIAVTLFYTQLIIPILVIAVTLTIIEFTTTYGLDNLTMPLVASCLLFLLI